MKLEPSLETLQARIELRVLFGPQAGSRLHVTPGNYVGGTTPFVTTENGDRITRGGDVNGNTLMIVKDTEIIFEGSERFRISR